MARGYFHGSVHSLDYKSCSSFSLLFVAAAKNKVIFLKLKSVSSPKQLDSSWDRVCWLTGWLADKLAWGTIWSTVAGLAIRLTSWLCRQKAVILELVVRRAVHYTYHMRNVLSTQRWGSLQYHIRASTTGFKYQRQEDTLVHSGRRGVVIQRASSIEKYQSAVLLTNQMKHLTFILTLTLVRATGSCSTPRFLVKAWATAVTWLTTGVVLALALESKGRR